MSKYISLIENNSVKHFDKIKKICAPLESLSINHFYYSIVKNDGTFNEIGTNLSWLYNYADAGFYRQNPFKRHPRLVQPGVYPHKWVTTPAFSEIVEAGAKCKVYPFILVIEKIENGFIRYGFNVNSHSPEDHLVLINEMDLIKKFVDYFRAEANGIFEKINNNAINIAEEMGDLFNSKPDLPKVRLGLFERINTLRAFGLVDDDLMNIKFTRRELECIKMRINHKTATETALALGLSKRTVENYLANIRGKLNCDSRMEWKRKLEQLEVARLAE